MNEVRILEIIGITETVVGILIIASLIAIISKNYARIKDAKLFDKIKTRDFTFNDKSYKDNRKVLGMYIESYIMYGYNVKCNMTDIEFRASLVWFMSCFKNCDKDEYGTLVYMLDTISTTLRKSGKCGDKSCIDRTQIIMKKIESDYNEIIDNGNESEHTELLREIHMLMMGLSS